MVVLGNGLLIVLLLEIVVALVLRVKRSLHVVLQFLQLFHRRPLLIVGAGRRRKRLGLLLRHSVSEAKLYCYSRDIYDAYVYPDNSEASADALSYEILRGRTMFATQNATRKLNIWRLGYVFEEIIYPQRKHTSK